MLRTRKITDTRAIANRAAVEEVQAILRAQFPGLAPRDIEKLPEQLENPLKYRFVSELLVTEDARDHVRAFAILLLAPDIGFAFLEFISTSPERPRSGLGGALYERVREEAAASGAFGLFLECLPDDPALSPDPAVRAVNADRLRFYERFGARPIIGTAYETPVRPGDIDPPYLVFDGLGRHPLPEAAVLRKVVRAILERKYGDVCPPDYVDRVISSIRPGGYHLRPPRYEPREPKREVRGVSRLQAKVPMFVNDAHIIHHVRDRGYVEAPVRISSILSELDKTGLFARVRPRHFPDRFIREVHDASLVSYLERACAEAPENRSLYPYVFPLRNPDRRPRERSVLAGYWCMDTFTPINRNAYPAARGAVDCALSAAERVLEGAPLAYALVRPPGHHAERRAFGGFCYFNNSAIAANFLSRYGRVALLDIDYHHGNGAQDIFYERDDVLTVSIHGHPSFAYPYFTGFREETGRGCGAGMNLNIPLGEQVTPEAYRDAVRRALRRIAQHDPAFLVLAVGFDTAKRDPTGTWSNRAEDFLALGRLIGETGYPVVAIQEGGYRVRTLGINARNFFTGLVEAVQAAARSKTVRKRNGRASGRVVWREAVSPRDVERVRALVAGTGAFNAEEIEIAAQLVEERISRGVASGYSFVLAEQDGRLLGYACHGPIAGSDGRHELYWIAVAPDVQGHGHGAAVLARAEDAIRRAGGRRIYLDTSTTERYAPARAFYLRHGYRPAAEIADFYRSGDGKIVFEKVLAE